MVIAVDRADTTEDGRDGHEDLEDMLEPMKQYTKWRWIVKEGNRIPEWFAHAFKIASIAPCGPTFVRVPRNVLYQKDITGEIFTKESLSVPMNLVPNPRVIEDAARMLIETRNEAESVIMATEKALRSPDFPEVASREFQTGEQRRIEQTLAGLKHVLGSSDRAAIQQWTTVLNDATRHLAEVMMNRSVQAALTGRSVDQV